MKLFASFRLLLRPTIRRIQVVREDKHVSHSFRTIVLSRRWLTFIVLGVSFMVFGASTVNLGLLFMANARLLGTYGWQAVMDGALWQSIQLIASGYLSMAAYVVFKTCEHRLSDWLGHGH
jgi:hypothetical protein